MAYTHNFKHADDIVAHLNTIVPDIRDPLLAVKYVGFVTIAAVTVYELAIKEIFISFAHKKHRALGTFTEKHFDRINGKIRANVIADDYLTRYGQKYSINFKKRLDQTAAAFLREYKRDIRSAYGNIITWRNEVAHGGKFNSTATYDEVVQSYEDGKEVVRCLAEIMVR